MSTRLVLHVHCDRCGATAVSSHQKVTRVGLVLAETQARHNGWTLKEGDDLCPGCAQWATDTTEETQ